MNSKQFTKDQVASLLYSIAFFVTLSASAVALDLLSQWVVTLGVSKYTSTLIALTAHAMLTLDVVLFLTALCFSAWDFFKELRK